MSTTDKSTSTQAQVERTLAALEERPHSTVELRALGIYHPAGRVKDLRCMGYKIITQRVYADDAHDYRHKRIGLYVLLGGATV